MKPTVFAAFTADGVKLASRLAAAMKEMDKSENFYVFAPQRLINSADGAGALDMVKAEPLSTVYDWAGEWFGKAGALVFVAAAGIAVRAIAPHVRDKTTDPAVVVLDDAGRNVISLLSGHIGGGNGLAGKIAALTGGRAVVTTATDTHEIEAADEWAARNGCSVENPEAIKAVSAAMLENLPVGVAITDEIFDGFRAPPWPVTLWLRPRVLVLGVGCKRGIEKEALAEAAGDFLRGAGRSPLSLKAAASISLKRDEPAITAFCGDNGIPFLTYDAGELSRVPGRFSSSQKVMEATGVDNVCERAAVLAAGGGPLLRSKTVYPGIALALAREAAK